MRTIVATILHNLFLLVGTLICAISAVLCVLVGFRAGWWFSAQAWSRGLIATALSRLEVDRSGISAEGAVYMANHQSLLDIPLLLLTLPLHTRFLAKHTLFKIPIFGQALRMAGFVPVDRQKKERARDAFDSALRALQNGDSILVFPEETRSADGELLPFKKGGFLLAIKAGRPIVPIGINGTARVRSKGNWLIQPGKMTIRYGEAVDPSGMSARARRELVEDTRERILALMSEPPTVARSDRVASRAGGQELVGR